LASESIESETVDRSRVGCNVRWERKSWAAAQESEEHVGSKECHQMHWASGHQSVLWVGVMVGKGGSSMIPRQDRLVNKSRVGASGHCVEGRDASIRYVLKHCVKDTKAEQVTLGLEVSADGQFKRALLDEGVRLCALFMIG